jgi:hypothetical protein
VCAAQGRAIFEFFANWQGRLASDEAAQRAFAASRGFCAIHSWQFSQIGSPVGLSTGYAPLVERTASELRNVLSLITAPSNADLSSVEPANAVTCAACEVLRQTEAVETAALVGVLGDADPTEEQTGSLCLPHLRATLSVAPDTDMARRLIGDVTRNLDELAEDMRSYVLKREALRRGLINTREERAWRRALVTLVGERAAQGAPMLQDEI